MMLVMMFTTWTIAAIRGYKPARTEKAKPREVGSVQKSSGRCSPGHFVAGIRTVCLRPLRLALLPVYAAFVGVFI
ncbi:MAG: hypothetical protein ACLUI3_03430 [Christensenellales bacterium]